ncbi:4-alpha-glucanotransferase [Floccifex sp.]|uniref:4-alpha-glucanotransferase n=1 Tax=Floccifex sp. TaxID=2815810 RepID=UPI003F108C37
MKRQAGFLCPLFSVPGNQGIGDLGRKTEMMIDYISQAGYSFWQILPLQITGWTHSPYQALSSYAGDPIYINLDRLAEMGLITQSSVVNCNKFKSYVDYDEVRAFKEVYFQRAFRTFKKNFTSYQKEYNEFKKEAFWLDDWAIFKLFRDLHDNLSWNEWDDEYRNYPQTKEVDLDEYQDELLYIKFLQFIFYKQLDDIRNYAHSKGVKIMGDVPFYVDYDSADVWTNKKDFLLYEDGSPKFIAGCPPDYFSETGQRWGMPIYDFENQEKDGFTFWCNRMKWTHRCYDMVRIDHFRAFDTYWKIPASCPTAVYGEWILGPSDKLIQAILDAVPGIELIAEDLGDIRKEVIELEEKFDIPGMDVVLFRMEPKLLKKPSKRNEVIYTGTHDNATVNQAYQNYSKNQRINLRRFFKKQGYDHRNFNDLVCHYVLDSNADVAVLPIWDICGFKQEARINLPGTCSNDNWTWKLKDYKNFEDEMMKTREWILSSNRGGSTIEK